MTVIDEKGDTALTVAKTPSMVKLLKGNDYHVTYM